MLIFYLLIIIWTILNWNQCQSDNNDKEVEEAEAQAIFERHLHNDFAPTEVHYFNVPLNKIY